MERRNSSDKSILSLGGNAQVVFELQVQEEMEGVRQEVREAEGESKARRKVHMNMNMWMGRKTHYLSHGACARDVTC